MGELWTEVWARKLEENEWTPTFLLWERERESGGEKRENWIMFVWKIFPCHRAQGFAQFEALSFSENALL